MKTLSTIIAIKLKLLTMTMIFFLFSCRILLIVLVSVHLSVKEESKVPCKSSSKVVSSVITR